MSVLNPELFATLKSAFGAVRVANEGMEMTGAYVSGLAGKGRFVPAESGEYYRVNCPFCSDTRHRLYVNHRWGVRDENTGGRFRWAAHCFNEDCLAEPDNRAELVRMTIWYQRNGGSGRVGLATPIVAARPLELTPIPLPRDFVPLGDLPDDHLALQFLRGRHFNPRGVAARWGVGFSARASCSLTVHGRLVVPFRRPAAGGGTETVGWQCRRLIDDGDGVDVTKYLTARGFRRSVYLYGAERVPADGGPLVVCEGVTDVWRYGDGAVAVLGKFASHAQRQILLRLSAGRPVVVAFDGDARADADELAAHLAEDKRQSVLYRDDNPVRVLPLPPDADPGSLRRADLRARVLSLLE
jgi:hypothetical protein